jgi:hypothetical protein
MHSDAVEEARVSSVVAGFLRLLASQPEIPAATIADVVLFATGEKSAMRFAVPGGGRADLDRWASDCGLAASSRTVGLKRVADWTCLGVDESSATAHLDVVVYAKSQETASLICELETNGRSEQAGLLLGYPPCCVAAYEGYSKEPTTWIKQALARSGLGPFPCWANRLPISWGAPTFIGELYPCAFNCAAAERWGRAVFDRLREYGLVQLAQTILAEAIRPIAGGSIAAPREMRRVPTAPNLLLEFVI